ncbi:integrase [Lachnospiraceae bacterium PH1-22]
MQENEDVRKVFCKISHAELLSIAQEVGTIDEYTICKAYMKKQDEKYLKMHCHRIWQGKNGCWYTYLDDETRERGVALKKRTTREAIEKIIIEYWKNLENRPLVRELFSVWIGRKEEYAEVKKQTIQKYKKDFKRFFEGSEIIDKRVEDVTEDDLDAFIRSQILQKELTNKAYSGLRTIIRGMFKMAKLKKWTKISISLFFQDIDLSSSMFKRPTKDFEKEVFFENEIPKIREYLDRSDNFYDWGILLVFETGIRVGELSVLMKSDVGEKSVHITKTEVHYYDEELKKNVRVVQDMAKTDAGDRYVILTDRAKALFKRVISANPDSEYLFQKRGNRISYNRFNKRLKKACEALSIPPRTMHKIRKTYGTTLLNSHVDESLVANQMGHTDISTTKKFYYIENHDEESKIVQIQKALG